jgi:tRNA modification GTPase
LNKLDIADDPMKIEKFEKLLAGIPHVSVSAKESTGLDQLEKMIADLVLESGVEISRDILVTSIRHKECLLRAAEFLHEVLSAAAADVSLDILSIDLKAAWEALGEINGDTVGEDLLDRIFSEFCIGK